MKAMSKNESKLKIDSAVGINIRRERSLRKITRSEMAKVIGVTEHHLGLMERGERGVTSANLLKIANLIGKPIGSFFEPLNPETPTALPANSCREKIEVLLKTCNEKELELVAAMLTGIIDLR